MSLSPKFLSYLHIHKHTPIFPSFIDSINITIASFHWTLNSAQPHATIIVPPCTTIPSALLVFQNITWWARPIFSFNLIFYKFLFTYSLHFVPTPICSWLNSIRTIRLASIFNCSYLCGYSSSHSVYLRPTSRLLCCIRIHYNFSEVLLIFILFRFGRNTFPLGGSTSTYVFPLFFFSTRCSRHFAIFRLFLRAKSITISSFLFLFPSPY